MNYKTYNDMKKLFFLLACVAMSVLSFGQDNQLVWANGHLLYGTPIESIDSLTYDEMQDIDTLHLLLPRTLIKVVHDTVYIETDCDDDTPSAGIGTFSVSVDKQVTFSKGNLQYTQSTNTWSFASAQWEVIGTDNVTGGSVSSDKTGDDKSGDALADKIDLFGWGTGNEPTRMVQDYGLYNTFVDWGINRIGAEAPNTWRTLTYDEWVYLFNTRTNAGSLYGIAQVNGVNGMVVLPDDWTAPEGISFKSGLQSEYIVDYSVYQSFTDEQWQTMEQAGAVFLPASGFREGTNVGSIGYSGNYWSSTEYGDIINAYSVYFRFNRLNPQDHYNRDGGQSVRLVKDL